MDGLFESTEAVATVAVRDLGVARKFYEDTLGLKPVHEEGGELVAYQTGKSMLNVYHSRYAGTNQATAVSWDLGDRIEDVVRTLRARGVTFEHYTDLPGMTLQGDLHLADGAKLAWFKDPDGNILNLVGR